MEQEKIEFSDIKKLSSLDKGALIQRYELVYDELQRALRENYKLRNQKVTDSQLHFVLQEQLQSLQDEIFGASSERYKKREKPKEPRPSKPRVQRPSVRYPNLPVREEFIQMDPPPNCGCCGLLMQDSGMTEESEELTVIPKKYEVKKKIRVKYRCIECHGDVQTAPLPPRIIEGSAYSDEMIQDVAMSKYCDLIPVERYAAMAARSGLKDLPPNSLIETTHYFADFVIGAYLKIKEQVMGARVLHADETPHRMLEGSEKKSWYLWGFSTPEACYLECHDTRSGDVASGMLINSRCQVLVTDVYAGYNKAVRLANEERAKRKAALIFNANCNAHSRRYFHKSLKSFAQTAGFYLDHYHEIYNLNAASKGKPPDEVLKLREQMKPHFEAMRKRAVEDVDKFPADSKIAKAMKYFLENYEGLTFCLTDAEVAIDNNSQERHLRSHVVGRKTWYGTHSERGARTAAIMFTLVETCKLNQVNPREYFKRLVEALLSGKSAFTPAEFKVMTIS
jgi:transposase